MSIELLKSKVNALVYKGFHDSLIVSKIFSMDEYKDLGFEKKALLTADIAQILQEHNNYKQIQDMLSSKILLFNDDSRTVIQFDPHTLRKTRIDLKNYQRFVDPKIMIDRYVACNSDYNPHKKECFYEEAGTKFFNTYEPPFWLKDHFFFGDELPAEPEMPECYRYFLAHLLNDDERSIDYVTRWIAYGLRAKNNNALTTIGRKGVGKGVLGEILSLIFGKSNSGVFRGTQLGSRFNGVIRNKTLVYIDEVYIKNTEEENNFKMLVNHEVEVERKGVDATTIRNYANLYMSSNQMDSIRVTSDERRFSIVNLTEKKLNESAHFKNNMFQKIEELKDPENIAKLARYLWHLNPDPAGLESVFESEQFRKVRVASFLDWEHVFVGELVPELAGKEVPMQEVVDKLKLMTNRATQLTSKSFEKLQDKLEPFLKELPGKTVFKLHRPRIGDKRPFMFTFPKASEFAHINLGDMVDEAE